MKYKQLVLWIICVLNILADNKVQYWDEHLAKCQGFDIRELTIKQAQNLFKSGNLTSLELTECYLNRIKFMNPHLNAILETNPDATQIAQDLDEFYTKTKKFRGALHGIPILLKDNIGTLDKMNTTSGAWVMLGIKPKEDAAVVKLLRKAGAIIIGKANLSEWSGYRSANNTMGWSGRGGRTKNPYVLSKTTAGSSSGSASAVAANLALVALGTETDGSIVMPSHLCSVVGFKPSVGFTSRLGVIPLSSSQDSVGAITRTVEDNIKVTLSIAEPNFREILSVFFKPLGCLNSIRVGVIMDPYLNNKKLPEYQKASIFNLLKAVPSQRIIIKELQADFNNITSERRKIVIGSEFHFLINQYLTAQVQHTETGPKSLQDIVNYNKQYHKEDLQVYDQSMLEKTLQSLPLNDSVYLISQELNQKTARTIIDTLINDHQVDILVAQSDYESGYLVTTPSAVAGYPIINIPVGLTPSGVPFGMTMFGRRGSEAILLHTGLLLESHLVRPLPNFLP